MIRSIGVQLGLLAFGLAIIAGLFAGNAPTTILTRALLVMLGACLIAQALACAGKHVLRDHLRNEKLRIDQEHLRVMREIRAAAAEETVAEPPAAPAQAS